MNAPVTSSRRNAIQYKFCTQHLQITDRLRKWQSFYSDFWGPTTIITRGQTNFSASLHSVAFGKLTLARTVHKRHQMNRNHGVSKLLGTPFFAVTFCEKGRATLSNKRWNGTLEPGTIVLSKTDQQNTISVANEITATQLLIPTDTLEGILPHALKTVAIEENANPMKVAMLRGTLQFLMTKGIGGNEGVETVQYFEKKILELMCLIVEMQDAVPVSDESSICFAHRLRIIRILQANLDNPDLKPALIAELSQLSESYIFRIFNASGDSLMHVLHKLRFEKARELLGANQLPRLSIGEVAFRCGFTSHSSFTRAFQSHCGMSPSEYRNTN